MRMKADERIEALLNRFGQTISDLPKPTKERWAYIYEGNEVEAALKWASMSPDRYSDRTVISAPRFMCEYVRHLADVIDRMETALETAVLWASCNTCAKYEDCDGCEYMQDYQLDDVLKTTCTIDRVPFEIQDERHLKE